MSLSPIETYKAAFEDFSKNPPPLVGASFISMVATSAVALISAWAAAAIGGTAATVAFVALNLAVGMFFSIGMVGLSLKVVRGGRPEVKDLFAHGSSFPRALTSLISTLILGVGTTAPLALIPSVGPVLWAIAAVFMLSMTCLAPYYLVDKKQGPLRALWSSVKDTGGHRLPVMGLIFLSTLLMGVAGLVPVIGPVVASPIVSLAMARAYTKLNGEGGRSLSSLPLPPEPPMPVVSEEQVESTLKQFEDELRAGGQL